MYYFYLNSDFNTYTWNDRSVFGDFYIEINDILFPNKGWSDIISSILNMWIDNIIKLLQGDLKTRVEFDFMDGPYYFEATCGNNDLLDIYLFSRDIKVNDAPYEISFYNFISEIISITSSMLRTEKIKDVSSIKELSKKYSTLKKIAKYKGYEI